MKIWELLKDHEPGNSDYQDDRLVTIRAGGTVYGMYKQALRELYKRVRGLRELVADRDLLVLDVEEQEERAQGTGREARRAQVEAARMRARLEEVERAIRSTEREAAVFYRQALALKARVGELTPERRYALEAELWEYRVREMAALDAASTGRLSAQTIEHINALPAASRETTLAEVRDGTVVERHAALIRERDALAQHFLEVRNENDDEIHFISGIMDAVGKNPAR